MSLTLTDLKAFLSATHNEDDTKLTLLLSSAEDELLRFLGTSELPDKPSINLALCFFVRASYDAPDGDEAERWREIARSTAHSYRVGLGA